MSPPLDADAIVARSRGACPRAIVLAETGSTNDDAKALAHEGADAFTVVVADRQRAGRGRLGRTWEGPPGASLLASVILRPSLEPRSAAALALVVGLSVCRAIEARSTNPDVGIKWPNDVVVGPRKLCGVLVEASFAGGRPGAFVAGFGVNVLAAALDPAIAHRATSLEAEGATDLDRNALLGDAIAHLRDDVAAFEAHGLAARIAELRARDRAAGRSVRVDGALARAVGIGDGGELLIEQGGARRAIVSGEIDVLFEPVG